MLMWDRLSSLVSGLGGSKDKAASVYRSLSYFTPMDAVTAYRGDWIARKVVDIPAMDMTRAWRNWQADDEQIQALEAEERRLCLKQRVLKGLKWARLFGGAGLILGTKDTDPSTPLDPTTIGKGGLTFVHVASSMQLTAGETDRDPASPGYGEPSVYKMTKPTGGTIDIHPSRVVRLIGAELPDDWGGLTTTAPANTSGLAIGSQQGWGDSVLQALDDAVKNAGIAAGGIASLVMEAKVDVYKIPRLMQSVSNPDYRQKMIDRFSLANEGKSLQNALLMDAEEEYEQKTVNFSGLNEVLTLYLEVAAAAADIPATRMLAKQSKGLGNGGEADLKNYYDKIGADQEMSLRPGLEKLDELLIRSALGSRPPEVHFAFAPLWQMSETERAAIRKQDADTAKVYADSGLIPKKALAAAVQNALVEHASYPGLEAAIAALGERPDGDPWTGVSDAEYKTMLAAWQSGAITQETLFLQLQAAGKIEAGISFDAYVEQIANESPPPSAGEEGVTHDPVAGQPLDPAAAPADPAQEPLRRAANDKAIA